MRSSEKFVLPCMLAVGTGGGRYPKEKGSNTGKNVDG